MHEVVIEAGRLERQYWKDLWRYRELLYFLAWRDILVRYKQTVVGAAWVLIRPFLTMIVLTVVFSKLAGMQSADVPYPILVLCGTLPWQFFSTGVSESGGSILASTSLISKVYFPRMAVPTSVILTSLADFMVSAAIMVLLMLWYQFVPSPRIVLLPIFVLQAFVAALGLGLWFSALTVRFRDFRHIIPFIAQIGMYISPVGFSSGLVPHPWRLLYSVNPIVGVIDGFRWAILGNAAPLYAPGFVLSACITVLCLVTGVRYFRSTERTFADII